MKTILLRDGSDKEWTIHFQFRRDLPQSWLKYLTGSPSHWGFIGSTLCRLHRERCDGACPMTIPVFGGLAICSRLDTYNAIRGENIALSRAMLSAGLSKEQRTLLWSSLQSHREDEFGIRVARTRLQETKKRAESS